MLIVLAEDELGVKSAVLDVCGEYCCLDAGDGSIAYALEGIGGWVC